MQTPKFVMVSLLVIILASCVPKNEVTPTKILIPLATSTFPPPTSTIDSVQSLATPTESQLSIPTTTVGFMEPDPQTWVALMPAVREYLYYRKKAVIAGNIELLWKRYPELKDWVDFSKGINAEEFFIKNMQGLKPIDGNIFPEYYERMKAKVSGETAEVLVYWLEL